MAPAMNMIYNYCNNNDYRDSSSSSPKQDIIFYFHNKGVSRHTTNWKTQLTNKAYAYVLYWRKYLEYYTIERPYLCLAKLLLLHDNNKEYYTCGPNYAYKSEGGRFASNFWSATCEHVITNLEPISSTNTEYAAAELWMLSNKINFLHEKFVSQSHIPW